MRNRDIVIAALTLLMPIVGRGDWVRHRSIPAPVRAFVIDRAGNIIGFAADPKRSVLFFANNQGQVTSRSLPNAPHYYAYAHDAAGNSICIAVSQDRLDCYSKGLAVRSAVLSLRMTSGALLHSNRLSLVDAAAASRGAERPIVVLQESAGRWRPVSQIAPPACGAREARVCAEVELHPVGEQSEMAAVPVMGSFDGRFIRLPAITFVDLLSGQARRVKIPDHPVGSAAKERYARFVNRAVRVVYRSAVSAGGQIALILEPFDSLLDRQRKHDHLTVWSAQAGWRTIATPGQVTAVAFRGESPAIVTADGSVFLWR